MVHHGDDGAPLIRLRPLPCETAVNGGDSAVRFVGKLKRRRGGKVGQKLFSNIRANILLQKKKIIIFQNRASPLLPPSPPSRILLFFKTTRVIFKFSILEARSGEEHVRFAPCPESDTVQNRYFEATSDDGRIVCRFVYIITYTRYEAINCSR